jgi:hypothetical protein
MLKVWRAGVRPWSRPLPDYRRAAVIFKPCGGLQPAGYQPAEKPGVPSAAVKPQLPLLKDYSGILVFRGPQVRRSRQKRCLAEARRPGIPAQKAQQPAHGRGFRQIDTARDWTVRINDRLFARTTPQKLPGPAA